MYTQNFSVVCQLHWDWQEGSWESPHQHSATFKYRERWLRRATNTIKDTSNAAYHLFTLWKVLQSHRASYIQTTQKLLSIKVLNDVS